MTMVTKLGRVVTGDKGRLPIMLHDLLIMWSFKITR